MHPFTFLRVESIRQNLTVAAPVNSGLLVFWADALHRHANVIVRDSAPLRLWNSHHAQQIRAIYPFVVIDVRAASLSCEATPNLGLGIEMSLSFLLLQTI